MHQKCFNSLIDYVDIRRIYSMDIKQNHKTKVVLRRQLLRVAYITFIFLFFYFNLGNAFIAVSHASQPSAPQNGSGIVHLLQSSSEKLVIEVRVPEFEITQLSTDQGNCSFLDVVGFSETEKPGSPRLPVTGTMVGIPSGSQMSVQVLEDDLQTIPGNYHICPQKGPSLSLNDLGELEYAGVEAVKDPLVYAQDQFIPVELAQITSRDNIRSQATATLRFSPFQYNPLTGELRYTQRILVQVNFSADHTLQAQRVAAPLDQGSFEHLLEGALSITSRRATGGLLHQGRQV